MATRRPGRVCSLDKKNAVRAAGSPERPPPFSHLISQRSSGIAFLERSLACARLTARLSGRGTESPPRTGSWRLMPRLLRRLFNGGWRNCPISRYPKLRTPLRPRRSPQRYRPRPMEQRPARRNVRRPPASTKVSLRLPSRAAIATGGISGSSPSRPASSAGESTPIRTTWGSCSRARWAGKRAMSSSSPCAASITGRSIAPAMRRHGGGSWASIRSRSHASCGSIPAWTKARCRLARIRNPSSPTTVKLGGAEGGGREGGHAMAAPALESIPAERRPDSDQ